MAWELPIILLVAVSLMFYLLGADDPSFQSPFLALISSLGSDSPATGTLMAQMISIFTDPVFLGLIGVATVSTFLLSGSSTLPIIFPIFLIVVVVNFFILPINFIFSASYDPTLKIMFGGILNMFLILGMVSFVRSG